MCQSEPLKHARQGRVELMHTRQLRKYLPHRTAGPAFYWHTVFCSCRPASQARTWSLRHNRVLEVNVVCHAVAALTSECGSSFTSPMGNCASAPVVAPDGEHVKAVQAASSTGQVILPHPGSLSSFRGLKRSCTPVKAIEPLAGADVQPVKANTAPVVTRDDSAQQMANGGAAAAVGAHDTCSKASDDEAVPTEAAPLAIGNASPAVGALNVVALRANGSPLGRGEQPEAGQPYSCWEYGPPAPPCQEARIAYMKVHRLSSGSLLSPRTARATLDLLVKTCMTRDMRDWRKLFGQPLKLHGRRTCGRRLGHALTCLPTRKWSTLSTSCARCSTPIMRCWHCATPTASTSGQAELWSACMIRDAMCKSSSAAALAGR